MNPKGEDALVGFAKLSRASEDAAAIDPDGKSVGVAVFERERFAREFGGAVK